MNQYTSGKFDRIENARRIIAKHHPGFEYAGDFKDTDSPVTIRCKICGTERTASMITLRHDKRITCSECQRREAERQKQKEDKAKAHKEAIRKASAFNNKTQLSMRFCEACGEIILGTRQRFCRPCAQRIQNRRDNVKKDKRRVAAFTVDTHTITLVKLYARDKGICWLCGQPCDFSAGINDNLYPSIDHIVPISKGGKDEWANIKLAHRICNSKRGDGGPT